MVIITALVLAIRKRNQVSESTGHTAEMVLENPAYDQAPRPDENPYESINDADLDEDISGTHGRVSGADGRVSGADGVMNGDARRAQQQNNGAMADNMHQVPNDNNTYDNTDEQRYYEEMQARNDTNGEYAQLSTPPVYENQPHDIRAMYENQPHDIRATYENQPHDIRATYENQQHDIRATYENQQ